jgi:transposase
LRPSLLGRVTRNTDHARVLTTLQRCSTAAHRQANAQNPVGELRRFLDGEKATVVWDGLPVHRSRAKWAWLNRQRSWLVVERLAAYAPELNPVEGLWSSLKSIELANLTSPTLAEVIDQAHEGIERVRRTPQLAYSFLRHAGLSVALHVQSASQDLPSSAAGEHTASEIWAVSWENGGRALVRRVPTPSGPI